MYLCLKKMCNFAGRLLNLQVMTLLKKCLPDILAVLLFALLLAAASGLILV